VSNVPAHRTQINFVFYDNLDCSGAAGLLGCLANFSNLFRSNKYFLQFSILPRYLLIASIKTVNQKLQTF
jgi:hypothetical protein